jgi:hypothetical protein
MMLAAIGQKVRDALWGWFSYQEDVPSEEQTSSPGRRRLARGAAIQLCCDEAEDSIEKALQRYLDARR